MLVKGFIKWNQYLYLPAIRIYFAKKRGMKIGSLVLNVILLIAVGILFYLHFTSGNPKKNSVTKKAETTDSSANNDSNNFRIAYFEMDSVENNFEMVKDVKASLNKKEDSINSTLAKIDKSIRDKANEYQSQAVNMSQAQVDIARNDIMERQKNFDVKKQQYDQEYKDVLAHKMTEMRTKIENFLKEYNKTKGYTYIFSYEPGFIYYKDSAYNITSNVVKGLNEMYRNIKK
jgi:outer membrane protein